MREYELLIDDALKNGLTPYDIVPTNSQVLSECLGFRCGKAGIERYKTLTNPLPPAVNVKYSWPFPQYIIGEKFNILVVRDTTAHADYVYSLNDEHTVVNLIATIDQPTYGIGTMMEMADFGKYVFMTNGAAMLYYDVDTDTWPIMITSSVIPLMRTVCNFKGQAVGGNVVRSWKECDETFYVWSKIGSMDFTPDRRNEAGYRRCPYGGVVYNVRRLGDGVIGYSSRGITLLHPVEAPAATFGFKELSDVGLLNQGAINGSYMRHVFVGEDYKIREVTSEGVKELDYERYMRRLVGSIIVSYDPSTKDFFIGDGTTTFLLSPKGLTEIQQNPSAVWRRNKVTYMLPDTIKSDLPYIRTESFDMEYKGQKTIVGIESDIINSDNPRASVHASYDMSSWVTSDALPLNNEGIVAITAAGNSFKFQLTFDDVYDDTRISYMKIRYKMTDLRGIRGVYAPPLRGQLKG